ncbi:MAG TPA: hypothetical protein VLX29_05975 [Nitrospirota bacterium]|nr:hypothetical protein [Nitrospirota bacterium]
MRLASIILAILMGSAVMTVAQVDQQQQTEDKATNKSTLYQWIDDRGGIHITDNLWNVPTKYRDKARRLEESTANGESQAQKVPETSNPSTSIKPAGTEGDERIEWQQRMKDARLRLADAEKRYHELDQKRTELLGAWGGVASGQLEGRMKAQQMEQEMEQVQKEIENARNDIEYVIPEQARKAGVPPGWLRE